MIGYVDESFVYGVRPLVAGQRIGAISIDLVENDPSLIGKFDESPRFIRRDEVLFAFIVNLIEQFPRVNEVLIDIVRRRAL